MPETTNEVKNAPTVPGEKMTAKVLDAPTKTPTPAPKVVEAKVENPKLRLPSKAGLEVLCTGVSTENQAVQIVEDNEELPHDCMKPVTTALFMNTNNPKGSHPKINVVVSALEPLPYESGKVYTLSLEPVK